MCARLVGPWTRCVPKLQVELFSQTRLFWQAERERVMPLSFSSSNNFLFRAGETFFDRPVLRLCGPKKLPRQESCGAFALMSEPRSIECWQRKPDRIFLST